MDISVIGLGKLGLCTAACFASAGVKVIGVDSNPAILEALSRRENPIDETGLTDLLEQAWDHLRVTDDLGDAIANSEATLIIVPTPSTDSGAFTNAMVETVLRAIGPLLAEKDRFHIVDVVSTVMPGSCDGSFKPLLEELSGKRCGIDFGLAYNPEFIALGSVVHNFFNPDMVLIGGSDSQTGNALRSLYARMVKNKPHYAIMSLVNAEITKLSLNCYVTTKISFANELAAICEKVPGADVDAVSEAIGADTRVGSKYIKGGLGFGGPCFPRDNIAFQRFVENLGMQANLAPHVVAINQRVVARLEESVTQTLPAGSRVALFGLSYKPSTHIVEASQSLQLAVRLADAGYEVVLHDPKALKAAENELGKQVRYESDPYTAAEGASALILLTSWPQFIELDWPRLADCMAAPRLLVDSWRWFKNDPPANFRYVALGLGPTQNEQRVNEEDPPIAWRIVYSPTIQSLQAVLAAPAIRALTDAGKDEPIEVLFPFPIDTRYTDPETGLTLRGFRNRLELEEYLVHTKDESRTVWIGSIREGLILEPNAFDALAMALNTPDAQNIPFAALNLIPNKYASDDPPPFACWLRQDAFGKHAGAWLAAWLDGAEPPAIGDKILTSPGFKAKIESTALELELSLLSGKKPDINAVKNKMQDAPRLLRWYVAEQCASGDIADINHLPYTLLAPIADALTDPRLHFPWIDRMQRFLAESDWQALLSEASSAPPAGLEGTAAMLVGIANLNLNKPLEAMQALNIAMGIIPQDSALRFTVGMALMNLQRFADASGFFDMLFKEDPRDFESLWRLGLARLQVDDFTSAAAAAGRLMTSADIEPRHLDLALHAHEVAGLSSELQKYSRYIEMYPPLPADFSEKEMAIAGYVIRNKKSDAWVVDVGANLGDVSHAFLDWGHRVLSIEPDETLIPTLKQKTAAFGERAAYVHCACSDQNGKGSLCIGNERGFNTLDSDTRNVLKFRYSDNHGSQSVRLRRLDDLLDRKGIQQVSLLKIDVEGHELKVLEGLRDDWYPRIDYILFEYHIRLGKKMAEVLHHLFERGFIHGICFQHPGNDLLGLHLESFKAQDKQLNLNIDASGYGNIMVSKNPIFPFDPAWLDPGGPPIRPDDLDGRWPR